MTRLTLLLLSLGLAACATDDDAGGTSLQIVDAPLAGTVGGEPWTFVAGDTDAYLSRDDPNFFATLYPGAFTACGFSQASGNHLIVAIPKAPGEYPMDFQRNMTFVVGASDNLVAFNGKVVVDTVTATTVTGGLVGRYNGSNEVSGTFELTICPDTP